jgi:unsaturated rhamnogalacturonyl hydrolase
MSLRKLSVLLLSLALLVAMLPACETEVEDVDESEESGDETRNGVAIDQACALAESWVQYFEPGQNAWSWGAGVVMMGMVSLSETTGDEAYLQYVRDWLDHHIDRGYHITSSDTSIPGYLALLLYERTKDEKYFKVAEDVWSYLQNDVGRTSEGGVNHMGWITGNQIWIDTLFMIGPFLIKYGEIASEPAAYEEYALQLEVFRSRLRDPGVGLYRHRYDDDTHELLPTEQLYWGRGNGWIFASMSLAAKSLPKSVKENMSFSIEGELESMLTQILKYEDIYGRFHTILNREDTYLETSAGLLYSFGVGMGLGQDGHFAPERMDDVDRWMQGAIDQIVVDDTGNTLLLGTSYGTSPGDVAYYQEVLKGEPVAYGVGLFVLAACERWKAGYASELDPPAGWTQEVYFHPPVPCEGVQCAQYHIARGNFRKAKESLEGLTSSEGRFYSALIDIVRVGNYIISDLDHLYVGGIDVDGLLGNIADYADDELTFASADLRIVQENGLFFTMLDRLLMIENGGHSAIGFREYDLGEAFILDAAARLISVLPELYADNPELIEYALSALGIIDAGDTPLDLANIVISPQSAQELIDSIDKLTAGIEAIMGETDEQWDDLIPKNLLQLTGNFGIPGILVDTNVRQMIIDLGVPADILDMLTMPDDLVRILELARDLLEGIV